MKLSILGQILAGIGAISAAALPRDTSPNLARRQLVAGNTPFTALTQQQFLAQHPNPGSTPVQDGSPSPSPSGAICTSPRVRVEWRNMADSAKLSFVQAVQCLMAAPTKVFGSAASNRYEELVYVHQQMTNTIHQDGIFLPWHRYFVWIFETMLRNECQYTGAMPWWNEALDSANFAASGLFTSQYYGTLPPIAADGSGACITDGAFANTVLTIGPGLNNVPHCLSRAWNQTVTVLDNQSYVDLCLSRTNFTTFAVCNENGPHALGHNGIGYVMGDVYASPGDPIFFQHHGFVDRFWNAWQRTNVAFIAQVGGFTTPRCQQIGAGCVPMTADTVLASMGLHASVTVRDMMDIHRSPLCYTYDS